MLVCGPCVKSLLRLGPSLYDLVLKLLQFLLDRLFPPKVLHIDLVANIDLVILVVIFMMQAFKKHIALVKQEFSVFRVFSLVLFLLADADVRIDFTSLYLIKTFLLIAHLV